MNWALLFQSLWISSAVTLGSCVVGLAGAVCLASSGRGLRLLLGALGVGVLALPPFLLTNAWLDAFGFAEPGGWFSIPPFGTGAAIIVMTAMYWPLTMLALWAAWSRLDPALLESDPCVRGRHLVCSVLFPLGARALSVAAVITFVLSLNNFSVASVLQARTYPVEVWLRYNTGLDWKETMRAALPMALAPMLLLGWVVRKGVSWPLLRGRLPSAVFRRQIGASWAWGCALLTTAACVLTFVLPVAELVFAKGAWQALPRAVAAGEPAAWHSISYAATAALVCCICGLALALSPLAKVVAWPLWFLFFAPGTLLGISLASALQAPWLDALRSGFGAVVLVLVLRYLAISFAAARGALSLSDRRLLEVARLEGANAWQTFRHVYWPQCGLQLLAGAYAVFLLALWEVECVLVVVPPGGDTLAMRAFNLLHYGHTPEVNGICLMLLAIASLPLAVGVVLRGLGRLFPARSAFVLTACAALFVSACKPAVESVPPEFHSDLFSGVQVIGAKGAGLGQFTKPRSVAVDAEDNLYVADMTGRVQKFSPAGVFLLSWQMPQTELGRPKGMCRDFKGNIVVIEPHYSRLSHFTPSGSLVFQWGHHGTNSGELAFPRAAAVNSKGDIYVSEYGTFERVQKFHLHPGAPWKVDLLETFGSPGDAVGQFNRPEGLGLDSEGRVFVADSCNHRIQEFSADGQFLKSFGGPGTAPGQLSYPYDVAVDETGHRFVCEFGNSRIQAFDSENKPIETIGQPGTLPGQFNNPWSIALDSAGNLYVADSQNHRVQKLIRRQ